MSRLNPPVEPLPSATLGDEHPSHALLGGAVQAWRRSVAFSDRVPVAGWWGMFIVVVTFGAMANVYMSFRIDQARLQLAQLEQASALQEQINAELLRRIGDEEDLNQIGLWAIGHGLQPDAEPIWMIATEPILADTAAATEASGQPDAPTRRRDSLAAGWRNFDELGRQFLKGAQRVLASITLLPPAVEAEEAVPERASTVQVWLDRLFDNLRTRQTAGK